MSTSAKKTQLEINVLAHNTMAEYLPQLVEKVTSELSKFQGKQIFKVDDSLMEKCKSVCLGTFFDGKLSDGTHCYISYHVSKRKHSNHAYLAVKLCINGGSYDDRTAFTQYENFSADIFAYEDDKLGESMEVLFPESVDISEIRQTAAKAIEAAKAYDAILSQVHWKFRSTMNLQRLTNY